MTTKITDANIEATGVGAGSYTAADITVNSSGQITSATSNSVVVSGGGGGPKITGVAVTDNAWTVLDDTAVSVNGGYIKITGSGFSSGCQVVVGTLVATSVSFVSSTEVRAQVPAQTAGTYTVYLTNSDGGVAIRVNGINYSSTPTWTTTSPLPGAMKNTSISLQLAATSNNAVTYSLASGSTLPSGLTLSSSGLISGTTPDVATDTTYNFTVVAIDQENQDTPQAFQITINANDPYYELVALHLPGTGTNLATNNTFLDASANNFTITRNGNTTQGTFSPFSHTGWGNYFDGSGDYLSVTATNEFAFGTGDWSIEAWIYLNAYTGGVAGGQVFGTVNGGTTGYSVHTGQNIDTFRLTSNATGTWADNLTVPAGGGVPLNTWTHMAVCRVGANLSIFKNGTRVATTSSAASWNFTGTTGIIGRFNSGAIADLNGYLSNVRVIKGSSAYSPTATTITVSTTPLTSITGTQLLTCQSNRFVDANTQATAKAITVTGNTSVVAFSPFNPSVPYNSAIHGGSVYFDGTGDYLSLPASTNLNIAQDQPFTLEYWIYMIGDYAQPFSSWNGQGTSSQYNLSGGSHIYMPGLGGEWGATRLYWYYGQYGSFNAGKTCTVDIGKNHWVHIAYTRDSSNVWRLYVNGVSQTLGTYTSIGSPWSDGQAMNYGSLGYGIGGLSNSIPNQCYISGLKFVVGTALYTGASLTLPTAPPEVTTNTQVLTKFNNAGIYDATSKNVLETVGNAQISTTQSKWGGSSMSFDGTGDYLVMPSSVNLAFGTGDFTLEMWAYFTSVANFPTLTDSRVSGSSTTGFNLGLSSAKLQLYTNTSLLLGATTLSINTWYYIAVSRESGALKIFLNGSQDASTSNSTNWSDTTFIVGAGPSGANPMTGYIQDLRVTKGKARTITTPTAAFPTL